MSLGWRNVIVGKGKAAKVLKCFICQLSIYMEQVVIYDIVSSVLGEIERPASAMGRVNCATFPLV